MKIRMFSPHFRRTVSIVVLSGAVLTLLICAGVITYFNVVDGMSIKALFVQIWRSLK